MVVTELTTQAVNAALVSVQKTADSSNREVGALKSRVSALETKIAALESTVAALKEKVNG